MTFIHQSISDQSGQQSFCIMVQSPFNNIKHFGVAVAVCTIVFTLLRSFPSVLPLQSSQQNRPSVVIADPFRQRGPKHESPMTTACQCHMGSFKRKDPCCHRRFIGVHKGGHVLVSQLREMYFPKVTSVFVRRNSTQTNAMYELLTDYREVFIARDLYEMIVSGYLYHKSGKECWLDMYGAPLEDEPQQQRNTLIRDWEDLLQKQSPFVNNRSLCRYLADESTDIGIGVYAEYAVERWYRPFFDIIDRRQDTSRSKFLDLHQLDNDTLRPTLVPMLQDFFAIPHTTFRSAHSRTPNDKNKAIHDHGHDTSHDPNLRSQLKDLIHQFDETYLNGWIEKHHQWPPVPLKLPSS